MPIAGGDGAGLAVFGVAPRVVMRAEGYRLSRGSPTSYRNVDESLLTVDIRDRQDSGVAPLSGGTGGCRQTPSDRLCLRNFPQLSAVPQDMAPKENARASIAPA